MRRILGNALQKCGKKHVNPLRSSIRVVVMIAISPLLITLYMLYETIHALITLDVVAKI